MLRRVISFHLLVNRVRLHAVLVTIKHPTLNLPVMLLMQATMFLAQPNRARLLVLRELTTRAPAHPVHQPAQMPTLDITCQPPAKPARLLVPQERIKQAQVNPRVTMLTQATMFLARPKRARLLVLREPIKQAQDNPRVTLLTLDITFHPPANRARPLVW